MLTQYFSNSCKNWVVDPARRRVSRPDLDPLDLLGQQTAVRNRSHGSGVRQEDLRLGDVLTTTVITKAVAVLPTELRADPPAALPHGPATATTETTTTTTVGAATTMGVATTTVVVGAVLRVTTADTMVEADPLHRRVWPHGIRRRVRSPSRPHPRLLTLATQATALRRVWVALLLACLHHPLAVQDWGHPRVLRLA